MKRYFCDRCKREIDLDQDGFVQMSVQWWSRGTNGERMEIEGECERLDAENVKLRQQLADVTESMGRVEERCAKLRELMRDSASLLDATCDTYYEDDYHEIIERARELGVEVEL